MMFCVYDSLVATWAAILRLQTHSPRELSPPLFCVYDSLVATWAAILRLQTHSPRELSPPLFNEQQNIPSVLRRLSWLKASPMRHHQSILMLAHWRFHTVIKETCMSGQGHDPVMTSLDHVSFLSLMAAVEDVFSALSSSFCYFVTL